MLLLPLQLPGLLPRPAVAIRAAVLHSLLAPGAAAGGRHLAAGQPLRSTKPVQSSGQEKRSDL